MDFGFNTRRLSVRPVNKHDFLSCMQTRESSCLTTAERTGGTLIISSITPKRFRLMVKLRNAEMLNDQSYFFGVFTRSNQEFVGEVMLFDILRSNRQSASIGATIYSSYRRHGYASEAIKGLIRYGFHSLNLHRIEGQVNPQNTASIEMCKSIGFYEEGLSPGRFKEGGRWVDALIVSFTHSKLKSNQS
ncbi:acetyltransferase, ribosomal protein N-acetylase [Pseudomonas sp. GM79]|nr:acetyltransferase, ribosomal protein N-acetylase [Pseudomonas sp. GM79]